MVGGNYLHTAAWPTQAAVFDLEKARGGVGRPYCLDDARPGLT